MLDDVTKKRINTLRQILVGKLPDPKAQVEQITNGLIYKFMNDMDEQSVSMGGKSTYFSGKFQKYSWKNLMDTKTSGVEKIKLYSEAIEQMYNNENLPELFREIFKNSFLPFKDPSTLNMFLKEINEFHYSNSEKLGDAFEYLLSFMGSQGDAGQFRTPRHIIDFIVEIVNPQKNETILDPACGTAGFLISSYKHILNQNTKKTLGDSLTASDRKKIGDNLNGYDISPDMVKMSLANMYLHKFTNPKINEYDTLSSEDRWNEYYDVILANPPFFSPKGGITPHNRFGVNSTKAEVLFIDYINEHLKPNGRAGIIVPEGIIFQRGIAYKQLRKKLIETSLLGIISLPSGVFQPYSGVKTSILILDKKLSKEKQKIFYFEILSDGYTLNANRYPINNNDIPDILKNILRFKETDNLKKLNFQFIDKSKIKDDLILKPIVDELQTVSDVTLENLDEICEIGDGNHSSNYPKNSEMTKSGIPFIRSINIHNNRIVGELKYISIEKHKILKKGHIRPGDILLTNRGEIGKVAVVDERFKVANLNSQVAWLRTNNKKINNHFLKYLLNSENIQNNFKNLSQGSTLKQLTIKNLKKQKIPIPPIEMQIQIVEELNNYQKIIEGCELVLENYYPSVDINSNWEMIELNEVANFKRGPFGGSLKKEIFKDSGYLVYEQYHAINDDYSMQRYFIDENKYREMKSFAVKEGDIIISCSGTMGKISIIPKGFKEGIINQALLKLTVNTELVNVEFLKFYLQSTNIQRKFFTNQSGTAIQNVASVQVLKKIPFPKIDLDLQNKITNQIKEELNIVESNQKMIEIYKSKINKIINKFWLN